MFWIIDIICNLICKLYIISNIIKDHGKQNFFKGKICQNQLVKFRIDSLVSFYPINIYVYKVPKCLHLYILRPTLLCQKCI